MKIVIATCVFAAAVLAAQNGIKPRPAASDYPVQASGKTLTAGAALLGTDQLRGSFATDLARAYVVVEVGVYPKGGERLDIGPGDFFLRNTETGEVVRPAAPKSIAGVLQKAPAGRDVSLYPSVGVGYESGPSYDPTTGRRAGGVSTSVGLGVGVGDAQPAASDADRRTMETELREKQFPEKVVTAPVAGYLYFPVISKKKPAKFELEFEAPEGRMKLPLEAPARRK